MCCRWRPGGCASTGPFRRALACPASAAALDSSAHAALAQVLAPSEIALGCSAARWVQESRASCTTLTAGVGSGTAALLRIDEELSAQRFISFNSSGAPHAFVARPNIHMHLCLGARGCRKEWLRTVDDFGCASQTQELPVVATTRISAGCSCGLQQLPGQCSKAYSHPSIIPAIAKTINRLLGARLGPTLGPQQAQATPPLLRTRALCRPPTPAPPPPTSRAAAERRWPL
jgi:hypothetical protein